jgi:AcrR family transcriptional regulator
LRAARQRFAEYGYSGATIRGIAADAHVGAALVHHFYGTKAQLFAAAMRMPVVPSEVLAGALAADPERMAGDLGESLVRAVLAMWEIEEFRVSFLGLLRSSMTDKRALRMLKEFLQEILVGAIMGANDPAGKPAIPDDMDYRASLVASQMLGLGISLYLMEFEPLTSASVDDVAAAIGPTMQRYLTATVRAADSEEPPGEEA